MQAGVYSTKPHLPAPTPHVASGIFTGGSALTPMGGGITAAGATVTGSGDMAGGGATGGGGGGSWTPASLGTLEGWWDANDSGTITNVSGACSQWNDKSSNGNNLSQSTSAARPSITTNINSKGTLTFNSANSQKLISGALSGIAALASGVNLAFVYNPDSNAHTVVNIDDGTHASVDSGVIIYKPNGTTVANSWAAAHTATATSAGSAVRLISSTSNGSGSLALQIYVDGTAGTADTGGATNTPMSTLGVGGPTYSATCLNGDFAELVIWSGSSSTDRQIVEGYLAWKWGTQANLPGGHPYKSAAP